MQINMVTHPSTHGSGAASEASAGLSARLPAGRDSAGREPGYDAAPIPPMPNLWDNLVLQKLREIVREHDPSVPALVRAELSLDPSTSRVVVRVVEIGSEELVRQYPAEETLRLLARVREELGRLLSASA